MRAFWPGCGPTSIRGCSILSLISYLPPLYFAFVVNPMLCQVKLDQCDDHDDDEQYPCQRRSIANIKVLERLPVNVETINQRGISWSTIGHYQDERKCL